MHSFRICDFLFFNNGTCNKHYTVLVTFPKFQLKFLILLPECQGGVGGGGGGGALIRLVIPSLLTEAAEYDLEMKY